MSLKLGSDPPSPWFPSCCPPLPPQLTNCPWLLLPWPQAAGVLVACKQGVLLLQLVVCAGREGGNAVGLKVAGISWRASASGPCPDTTRFLLLRSPFVCGSSVPGSVSVRIPLGSVQLSFDLRTVVTVPLGLQGTEISRPSQILWQTLFGAGWIPALHRPGFPG